MPSGRSCKAGGGRERARRRCAAHHRPAAGSGLAPLGASTHRVLPDLLAQFVAYTTLPCGPAGQSCQARYLNGGCREARMMAAAWV